MTFAEKGPSVNSIFIADGELGSLMRSIDWTQTPLGDTADWPQSLRSALSILLPSKAQICLFWGPELTTIYNDAYCPALAAKHPWALGRPAREVWSEVWPVLAPLLEKVLTTGEAFWAQDYLFFLNRHGYSEETYFDVSYDPVRDESGNVGGIFCIVSETTGRVLGDRRLRALSLLSSEAALAKTVEAAYQAALAALATNAHDIPFALLYRISADGKQATLVETAGVAAAGAAAHTTVDLTQSDDWELGQVYRAGQSRVVGELATRFAALPTGAWDLPPASAWVAPLSQAGQDTIAGLLVLGINPYQIFENEYQEFFELVARNVATAIANACALEEERRRVEALAELDRAKTTFFSNISHEFRTPLTLMLSPLEETIHELEGVISADARSQLELVQRNGIRLLKLVNNLLDFSRIEAGRAQIHLEPTDLATYTAELAQMFRFVIEQVGLRLTVDCPPLPTLVSVDRELWEKVVLNLLSNAFKFTFEGEISVILRAVGDRAELVVRDTGTGIPAADLLKLFDRFHRVEGSRGRTFEGTGIGLSLVQELVHLQGGTIAVDSTLGQGSSFTVQLPLAGDSPAELQSSSPARSSSALATPYVHEALGWLLQAGIEPSSPSAQTESIAPESALGRILLVDDNSDMRNYLHRILSRFYEVEAVTGAEAALVAAHDRQPDLILSDVMMPGMDGFELLRQLRANPETREIPILLLSARAGEAAAIEGLEAGADDYLVKPFSAGDLLGRVAANVDLGRSRQTDQRHRITNILESITDAFFAVDRDWRFTYVNSEAERLLAHPSSELVGEVMWELYPGLIGSEFEQAYRRTAIERIESTVTAFYPDHDRWYEVHAYPAANGITVYFRDVTNHKQAEEALRRSEERFRALVSASSNVVYRMSADWSEMQELHGGDFMASTSEPNRDWLQTYIHPEDQARVLQAIEVASQTKSLFKLEHRIRQIDGSLGWIYSRAVPLLGEDGEITEWFGAASDISDRKQVAADLQQSEERYRTLFESIDEGFCIVEVLFDNNNKAIDYRFLELNPAFEAQTGLHEAVGKTARQLVPELEEKWSEIYGNVVLTGTSVRFEYEAASMNRWFDVYACRIEPSENREVAIVFKDITEAKRIETEREQILRLEQTARSAAERANQIKDEFLAVLSHELRTPLNLILGWTRLLRSGKLDDTKTAAALETIERNAKLQVQLIEDLLDISRILRGKLVLNMFPVDLKFAIKAALETVRLGLDAKAIDLETNLDSIVGQVMGDVGRLQQVVWNLLSNAVKFTPVGGRIAIELTQVETNAQIQVTDTGRGIHPEFLPYVFEHFRQEDGATTRQFGGLGLGLAIVRQIVELHGGTVTAQSLGEDQGATFIVQIPLSRTEAPEVEPTQSGLPLSDSPLLGIQVLVVDDEADTRDLTSFVLEQSGAIVTALPSAREALEALTQGRFDLLISDIGMPDMDGYSLIRQIRQRGNAIPAVALTAYAGEVDHQQAIAAGFQTHIAKPVEPTTIIAAIVRLCGLQI